MFWFFDCKTRGILVLWPGIESSPPALEDEVLTTGPLGKSLGWSHLPPALASIHPPELLSVAPQGRQIEWPLSNSHPN